jgi:hypothetical protein
MLGHADIIHHDSASLIYITLFGDEGAKDRREHRLTRNPANVTIRDLKP